MFRVWQTGKNSNNHHYLACSGFEIYGTLYEPLQPMQVHVPSDAKGGKVVLSYSYDFDTNGLFYWLGTRGRTGVWKNPGVQGYVRASSSPLAVSPPSHPVTAILGTSACLLCMYLLCVCFGCAPCLLMFMCVRARAFFLCVCYASLQFYIDH